MTIAALVAAAVATVVAVSCQRPGSESPASAPLTGPATARTAAAGATGFIVGKSGTQFTLDGSPRFLLFVSYFDALRRANAGGTNTGDLDADFAYLAGHGVDGIRIFPNWRYLQRFCDPEAADVDDDQKLFSASGGLNEAMWPVLLRVLAAARSHRLLVDVTFSRETYAEPLPLPIYTQRIVEVAARLKDHARFGHLLFDVQNEFDQGRQLMTAADAEAIVRALHAPDGDPLRLASASGGSDGIHGGMDFVAFHDGRDRSSWFTRTAIDRHLADIRAGAGPGLPVYFQEPMPFAPSRCGGIFDGAPDHARQAAVNAMAAGAAAWTFHTRQSFDLATQRLVDWLAADPAQKAALEAVAPALSSAGRTAPTIP
jgi:hypothetical protein